MSSDITELEGVARYMRGMRGMDEKLAAEGGDWRTHLPYLKDRVINKLTDECKRCHPFSFGQEEKLKDVVVDVEEKIYADATSQSDYLRQISSNFWSAKNFWGEDNTNSKIRFAGYLRVVIMNGCLVREADELAQAQAQAQVQQAIAAEASMEGGDWRAQLTPDSRDKIVNIIVDTLRIGIPYFGQEGLHKMKSIVVSIEEQIDAGASNHIDYLVKAYWRFRALSSYMLRHTGYLMRPTLARDSTNYVDQAVTEGGGWRTQISVVSRALIVKSIMDECKSHLPFSFGQEEKLKDLVVNFEEKIYAGATSQSDYLRQISSNFWAMDTNSRDTMGANSLDPGILRVVMDSNYWWEAQAQAQAQVHIMVQGMAAEASAEGGDWRVQLMSDSRDKIVNKIVETLSNGIPFFGQEGLLRLKRLAVCIEEKIYAEASSKLDYAANSYLKMKATGISMRNGASVSTNEANNISGDELSNPNEKDPEENREYRRGKRARKSSAKFDNFVMG